MILRATAVGSSCFWNMRPVLMDLAGCLRLSSCGCNGELDEYLLLLVVLDAPGSRRGGMLAAWARRLVRDDPLLVRRFAVAVACCMRVVEEALAVWEWEEEEEEETGREEEVLEALGSQSLGRGLDMVWEGVWECLLLLDEVFWGVRTFDTICLASGGRGLCSFVLLVFPYCFYRTSFPRQMDKDNNYYTLVRARQETPRCVEKECGGCTFRDSSLVYVAGVSSLYFSPLLKTKDCRLDFSWNNYSPTIH